MTTAVEWIREQLWPAVPRFSSVGAIGEFGVRAEIAGIDPAHDIRIWLAGRVLRVEVMRAPTRSDQVRSEFHYGRSVIAVDLPPGVDARRLSAGYDRGVLTIASTRAGAVGAPVAISSGPRSGVTSRRAFGDLRP